MTVIEFSTSGPRWPKATLEELAACDGIFGVLVEVDGEAARFVPGALTRMVDAVTYAKATRDSVIMLKSGAGWSVRVERFEDARAWVAVCFETGSPIHKSLPRSMRRVARNTKISEAAPGAEGAHGAGPGAAEEFEEVARG